MLDRFTCTINPSRIVFGEGSLSSVGAEVQRLRCTRAFIVCTPPQVESARSLAWQLGDLAAGIFADATMHTPGSVTEAALKVFVEIDADCVVALGGGSAIGLGKAIALRTDAPQVVIATTYAGSEVTPILGETVDGLKTTVRDPRVLPETVIYDPALTTTLPVALSVVSGLNAMAHAVEGLYAQDRHPAASLQASEGLRALKEALPRIVAAPTDIGARTGALYGSWLCGTVLGSVGMALHHKLCHTLGGSFDLPHAETHAVILPHSASYNSEAAAAELRPATELFGDPLGRGLYDFAASIGAPTSLRNLGMAESDVDKAADLAIRNSYWNPRLIERGAVRDLLQRAWAGVCPQ